jgi:hypothetical protein
MRAVAAAYRAKGFVGCSSLMVAGAVVEIMIGGFHLLVERTGGVSTVARKFCGVGGDTAVILSEFRSPELFGRVGEECTGLRQA